MAHDPAASLAGAVAATTVSQPAKLQVDKALKTIMGSYRPLKIKPRKLTGQLAGFRTLKNLAGKTSYWQPVDAKIAKMKLSDSESQELARQTLVQAFGALPGDAIENNGSTFYKMKVAVDPTSQPAEREAWGRTVRFVHQHGGLDIIGDHLTAVILGDQVAQVTGAWHDLEEDTQAAAKELLSEAAALERLTSHLDKTYPGKTLKLTESHIGYFDLQKKQEKLNPVWQFVFRDGAEERVHFVDALTGQYE